MTDYYYQIDYFYLTYTLYITGREREDWKSLSCPSIDEMRTPFNLADEYFYDYDYDAKENLKDCRTEAPLIFGLVTSKDELRSINYIELRRSPWHMLTTS